MYKMIGADGKQYGPVSAEQIQQWVREGRLMGQSQVSPADREEWKPLREFPELFSGGGGLQGGGPSMGSSGGSFGGSSGGAYVEPQYDGFAIGSLVCGIAGLLMCLPAIPAVILGHISRSRIRKSLGGLTGNGMAIAGLVMGYLVLSMIPILIVATIAIPSLLRSRQAVNESAAVANLRTINTAEVTHQSSKGKYGSIPDLVSAGLLDSRFSGTVSGYFFTITTAGTEYTATASPASSNTGRFGYYSWADGQVRYGPSAVLAPSGMAGQPVN